MYAMLPNCIVILISSTIVIHWCGFWRLHRLDISALHQAYEWEFDQLQMKDLRHALYSHGDYTLTPDFAAFTVPHAVWQVKSQQDKDAAFCEFLAHTVRQKWTATVTTSNGVLTVPARLNIDTNPYQRKHGTSLAATTLPFPSQLALFGAITFSRTRSRCCSVCGSSENTNEMVYHSPTLFTITKQLSDLSWNMRALSGILASHLKHFSHLKQFSDKLVKSLLEVVHYIPQ